MPPVDTVLNFQVCDGELLKRAKSRARADDTDEVIGIRLKVYREHTVPLIGYYGNKLVTVNGAGSIDEVFTRVLRALGR